MGLRGRENLTASQFFFVTTSVYNHAYVFTKDVYSDLLVKNIIHYQEKYNFTILGYVIMPTHFHWIIVNDLIRGHLQDIMRDIKKFSAWDIMEEIERLNDFELSAIFKNAATGIKTKTENFGKTDLMMLF